MEKPAFCDLRSDTVTRPTQGMLRAMWSAEVGDDVFGEDPSIRALEEHSAALLGHEKGLFCPSGTMTNQIAIQVHCRPGDEVVCDELAHIYLYEGGGIARNAGASVRLLKGNRGRFTAQQVTENLNNPHDAHAARTRLVAVEDTANKGGGSCYNPADLDELKELTRRQGLAYHCDGARIFNAIVAHGRDAAQHGGRFDSLSVCLSKGLGSPVGSVLLGSRDFIAEARRVRKVMGGGMRQAGYLAAAGLYALQHHVTRLQEDHQRAQELHTLLTQLPGVREVLPAETNIVIFHLHQPNAAEVVAQLAQHKLLCFPFGRDAIRLVTHLDVHDEHLKLAKDALGRVLG